jgi:two-component system cell cycle response regulator
LKILVADDDRVSRRILERMLQQNGYEVMPAVNGREAANILAKPNSPRLALINWMMPELDGPEICSEVRSRHDDSYTYILLLTSKQLNEDIVKGLEAGADDYLTKPCHLAELKARLHTGRRILQLEDKLVETREEMRFKATHDALTSLWDRGAILALFRAELSRSGREKTPVSLLLCDIDHFKQINDGHGHQTGDEVLEEVSTRLHETIRSHDAVGRYGGEEFLVVLAGCSEHDVKHRAEQVREAICKTPFDISGGHIAVSMSIGAVTVEQWDESQPIEPILARADVALYQAKAQGRNRVVDAAPFRAVTLLFADAEGGEDAGEDVVGSGLAGEGIEGVEGGVEVDEECLVGEAVAVGIGGANQGRKGGFQRLELAWRGERGGVGDGAIGVEKVKQGRAEIFDALPG